MNRMYIQCLLFLLICLAASSCSKKSTSRLLSTSAEIDEIASRSVSDRESCNCLKNEHYIPRSELEVVQDVKYLRTSFLFPNSKDKTRNWTGDDMIHFAKTISRIGNERLEENVQMKLPAENATEVLDIPWRYKMHEDDTTSSGLAIYEVIDDNLYYYVTKGKNRNNSDSRIIDKYGRDMDNAVNVFVMSHHPDSIASKTYNPSNVGIALGSAVKIAGIKQYTLKETWKMATLFNHEMGHTVGLRHSWYKSDGCDDTPPHPNCYTAKPSGSCKGPISNNMMDYNHAQRALTPCQIGIANRYLHNPRSKSRSKVVKDWCDYREEKSLIIRDTLHLDRHVDLKGDIIVEDGAYLKISCTVNMPKSSKIIVHPKGTLVMNACTIRNDCGEDWLGIEAQSKGKNKAQIIRLGEITLEHIARSIN